MQLVLVCTCTIDKTIELRQLLYVSIRFGVGHIPVWSLLLEKSLSSVGSATCKRFDGHVSSLVGSLNRSIEESLLG